MPTATKTPTLPTSKELSTAAGKVADAWELHVTAIRGRVLKVTNTDGPQDVSSENIAELLWYVRWMRDVARYISNDIQVIDDSLDDLLDIARNGSGQSEPRYDRYGNHSGTPDYNRETD